MSTSGSSFLWRRAPLLPFVQFPWRFLLPATCLAAPLVGLLPKLAPRGGRRWIRIALTFLAVTVATPYVLRVYLLFEPGPGAASQASGNPLHVPASEVAGTDPEAAGLVPPHRLLTAEVLRQRGVTGTASNDFLPLAVERLPTAAPAAAEILSGQARVLDGGWGYPSVWAEIDAASEARVALGQFWFPGWRVWLDGEEVELAAEPGRGRILVTTPPGRHRLEARYGGSRSVALGYGVSLLGWVVLWLCVRHERRSNRPTLTLAAQ
jgi:hypothetical protein